MRLSVLALIVAVGACAPPKSDTVTVCRGSACVEQSKDTVTYDPSTAVPDPDPEGRIPALEELAREDPKAAFDLGLRYMRGDGIRRDSYRALQWMRDAAERGNVQAQSALGRLYFTGLEEMGQDLGEADAWLSQAAAAGDKDAQQLLPQVRAARQDDFAFQRQLERLQALTYTYWYRRYPYYWYWNPYRRVYLLY